jgi:O-antigen/teichoic acid export membrane protein
VVKNIISINLGFSLLQSISVAFSYFFLYRILLDALGAEKLGIWSIVLSISTTSNIVSLGIGSSVTRLTAKYNYDKNYCSINKLIITSFLLSSTLFTIVSGVIYIIGLYWIRSIVDAEYLTLAESILPYSIICIFINAVSNVFLSCLDGFQKNYYRSILIIICNIILLITSIILVKKYDLLGVVYAQVIQSLFLLFFAIFIIKRIAIKLSFSPSNFDIKELKIIFSLGLREQIISIAQLCFDPVTKSFLASYGELSHIAFYEIANRFVTQTRGLLANANKVLIAVFAEALEKDDSSLEILYKKNISILYVISLMWITIISFSSFFVSTMMFDSTNIMFITFVIILSFGNFFNILSMPSYFSNLGQGKYKYNIFGNVMIAVLNIIFGFILAKGFGEHGVAIGWTISLAFGSLYIIYSYHKTHEIYTNSIINKTNILITMYVIIYIFFLLFDYKHRVYSDDHFIIVAFILSLPSLVLSSLQLMKIMKHP